MKKRDKYQILMTTFKGRTDQADGTHSFTYEIVFNKSLQHTGKYLGIERGLNRYDKIEPWIELWNSIRKGFRMLKLGINRLF